MEAGVTTDIIAIVRDAGGIVVALAAIGVLRRELRALREAVEHLASAMERDE
jgi:hypothetical protein